MSSSSGVYRSLRRLKPEKHTTRLKPRDRSRLTFIESAQHPIPRLLLDTTVYVDGLQGRLSHGVEVALRVSELWHSTVTEAELVALAGLLDPRHRDTPQVVRQVAASVDRRPGHRVLNPDAEIWREAGILTGLLARLQQYGKGEQRRALNDALIFLTAAKHGCAVLTRNVADFDFLMQLAPFGKAVFYERF
ncbi:MAG: type II toxin-antitoxin system VapC family toxin [Terracidiphilus sp.]